MAQKPVKQGNTEGAAVGLPLLGCRRNFSMCSDIHASYSSVPGFFAQDDPVIGALPPRFGLIDKSAERWQTFQSKISEMNSTAPVGTLYKVFFLGRHGQGFHNIAEAKYGTEAWDDHWSKLNGDSEITWGPDPLLTPLGCTQAQEARDAWKAELKHGMPLPQKFYCSPLKRALDTWYETFAQSEEDEVLGEDRRTVLILENCREEYGIHTCDLRSALSHLRSLYPLSIYEFEPSFLENDPVWRENEREEKIHIAQRATAVLEKIFREPETYISITSHGGFINGFLSAVGRQFYALPTGGIIPVVVQRTFSQSIHPSTTIPAAMSEY